MIQKKYMWGLVLGLLGSSLLVNDVFSMMRRGQESEIAVGSAKFNSMSEDEQISLLSQKYSKQEIVEFIESKKVKKSGVVAYFQRDQQQMTQSPENLYKNFQEQYDGNWDHFYGTYKSILNPMQINSLDDLKRQAGVQDEDIVSVKKDDFDIASGSEDKGKEEEEKSSSVVVASKEEIAAALQALLKLSDHLTLSKAIANQDEWKAFCNAFADLVESGAWDQSKAYNWDGTNLK